MQGVRSQVARLRERCLGCALGFRVWGCGCRTDSVCDQAMTQNCQIKRVHVEPTQEQQP